MKKDNMMKEGEFVYHWENGEIKEGMNIEV